jgi:hypothetical protein
MMASVNEDEKTLNKLLWEEYGIGMDAGVTKLKLGEKVALEGLGPIVGKFGCGGIACIASLPLRFCSIF